MILLGLGASLPGRWGTPSEAVSRCAAELEASGFSVAAMSSLYETAGVGPGRDSTYVNAVLAGNSHLPPLALWRMLKTLERRAGPRSAMPWGPRALDIDILDYKGLVAGWGPLKEHGAGSRRMAAQVVLPHSGIHERPFVLVPLLEIAPGWRHPVLRLTARELWKRISGRRAGRVLRPVDAPG